MFGLPQEVLAALAAGWRDRDNAGLRGAVHFDDLAVEAALKRVIDLGEVKASRWLVGVVGPRRLLQQDRHHREDAVRDVGSIPAHVVPEGGGGEARHNRDAAAIDHGRHNAEPRRDGVEEWHARVDRLAFGIVSRNNPVACKGDHVGVARKHAFRRAGGPRGEADRQRVGGCEFDTEVAVGRGQHVFKRGDGDALAERLWRTGQRCRQDNVAKQRQVGGDGVEALDIRGINDDV